MGFQWDKCLFHICGELKKEFIKEEALIGFWRPDGISTVGGAQREKVWMAESTEDWKCLRATGRCSHSHLPHKTAKAQVYRCMEGKKSKIRVRVFPHILLKLQIRNLDLI